MISVIIPVYNVEFYLDTCLNSVLTQTYSNLEVILIDDGSTDNSGLVCDQYAQKDNRVRVFHKQNGGVSSARNFGLEQATGQYISFIDPDDWIEQDMYTEIIKQFQKTEADVVFCGYWEDHPHKTKVITVMHSPEKQGVVSGSDALHQCLVNMSCGYFTSVWNKVFKTEFIKKSQVHFEKFMIGEDEVWLTKILPKAQKVALVNTPFYHWQQRESSVLHSSGNYDKWYSALQSKMAVIDAVRSNNELFVLSNAKIYADLFDTVWKAYIAADKDISRDFMKKLKPYEKAFYKHTNFSKLKRVKFFVIKLMIILHFPTRVIETVGNITKFRLKEKVKI